MVLSANKQLDVAGAATVTLTSSRKRLVISLAIIIDKAKSK